MTETMDKTYNPQAIEQHWYQFWEDNGHFKARAEAGARPYCIMIPPPNVTGTLHMGHAFQDTIMDALIRFNRMQGRNTLWQAGSDHAGIATQMVVERQLAAQGKSRHDLGREKFITKVWEWKEQSGNTITRQLRRMGSSLDWSRERFTMDEGLSRAVTEVFVRLFDEGLIYRGKRLVNWDPVLHTAVSDLEVISTEENGHLWHMRYPLAEGNGHLVVATTRPETMLGDSAVAVHPDDERYRHLIGKQISLPLTERLIPVIADEYVDPEFGSGCVKITPAHDFNDYEMGLRHKLPQINIFTIDARINEAAPEQYFGLDRFEARKRIVADLDALGLMDKIVGHTLMVPRGDRSGSVIEPFLTDQWYVKIAPLAEPAIKAVESGEIRFVPDNWKNTYYEWMRNIQDWCISRQIWWGHRIPAWYDINGVIYVGPDEAAVRSKYKLGPDITLRQDEDVLDTWFSSALWPFSTLGWPEQTPELRTFYPTSVLVTGFDIIFFWVARMIMMGLKFTGRIPFHEIYIHGLVRDSHGQKMSKSKGNVLDPLDLIDGIELEALIDKRTRGMMQPHLAKSITKQTRRDFPDGIPAFGTDALRFTFAALASTGRDIKFDLNRIEGYRNFCNKLWNAARYVLMNTENQDCGQLGDQDDIELSLPDRWITSRLQIIEQDVIRAIKGYRLDLAAQAIYEFTWNEYCDWYLELSKPVLNDPNSSGSQMRGTRRTLVRVLETILRLAHPIIPFITEDIWQRIKGLAGRNGNTIMTQNYPQPDEAGIDHQAIVDIEWLMSFILGVRKIRSSRNIAPGKPLPVLLQQASGDDIVRLDANHTYLMTLARLESIQRLDNTSEAPESATALVGDMKILIPMSGLIDKDAELARLNREIDKLKKVVNSSEQKLANPSYVEKAPSHVVAREQQKVADMQASLVQLQTQRDKMLAM